MKNLKRITLAAMLLLFGINFINAQRGNGNGSPEERAERQMASMKENLALSDAQAAKIKEVYLTYGKKMREARANAAEGDREKVRENMMAMRKEQTEELKKYLTKEQFEKYEKIQAERRGQRGPRGGGEYQKGKKRKGDGDKKGEEKREQRG